MCWLTYTSCHFKAYQTLVSCHRLSIIGVISLVLNVSITLKGRLVCDVPSDPFHNASLFHHHILSQCSTTLYANVFQCIIDEIEHLQLRVGHIGIEYEIFIAPGDCLQSRRHHNIA